MAAEFRSFNSLACCRKGNDCGKKDEHDKRQLKLAPFFKNNVLIVLSSLILKVKAGKARSDRRSGLGSESN